MLGCLYLRLGVLSQLREGRELQILRVTTTEASDQLRQRTAWALSQFFCVEFHHLLHLNRTVATLLRHLHADRLRELLAGDARGHLQSCHGRLAHPQG